MKTLSEAEREFCKIIADGMRECAIEMVLGWCPPLGLRDMLESL